MSHKSYQPIKPAASKMLAKRWDDSSYALHRSKLRNAKPTVDTRPPKTYMHLQLKLKKLQVQEERLATIERDNRILLEKMSHIMRTRGRVDNTNDYDHKSLNRTKRQQELLRIAQENQAILKRISAKQPFYDRTSWEDDYEKSAQYKTQIARFPDASAAPQTRRAPIKRHGAAASDDEDDYSQSGSQSGSQDGSRTQSRGSSRRSARSRGSSRGGSDGEQAAASEADGGIDKNALKRALAPGEAEQEALAMINDKDFLRDLWRQCDFNGNGGCSLAEIDKMVVERGWKLSKPTLLRAYKKTTLKDGDGDPWVERKEFPALIRNLFLFENVWEVFDDLDTEDDRRVDLEEFTRGMAKLGSRLSPEDAQAEFNKADKNGGGQILFREFCDYVSEVVGVSLEDSDAKWLEPVKKEPTDAERAADGQQDTEQDLSKFDELEDKIKQDVAEDKLDEHWNVLDFNGNGMVSLAEIDKWVAEQYPLLDHKPALMRAYKASIGSDDYVQKHELRPLLRNLFYFNKLWTVFDNIDTDDDRRIDLEEFKQGVAQVGLAMSSDEAQSAFDGLDSNDGGIVLFDEFVKWAAAQKMAL
eukprot:m.90880 g.90880  ORF g.90880 m.90880 type:complete len:585 (+) comp12932_c0_seq1:94-1848(+)